ncbi:MFS transporter [Vulcanimicrobium alpinum]|uniref:MFS transporter n=1 Tax=Vulcanimicrobium alpinum TaxID=3016050 RepID=A0AAN2C8C5_UNVUL|nr:MFS transporter [Vulcanimicrobium alpinum]BDE05430.1 MFS transporter [Vulcanimicrobium alpinum]
MAGTAETITTNIPLRLDRLPWARWHWMVVIALGITWILDGLEVTIVGTIGPTLTSSAGLSLSDTQASYAGSFYIVGACIGALGFGYLTDRFGRKKLFLITLTWYLVCTLLTAFSWDFWSFVLFRMLAGAGIGGEYSAVNSAIDELIPAKRRGIADIAINGSWWIGTLMGAVLSIPLLNGRFIAPSLGWRLAFGLGAVLAFAVLFVRRGIPESPRWLLTHGRHDEAERIASSIEHEIVHETGAALPDPGSGTLEFDASRHRGVFVDAARTMVRAYPRRTVLVLALMITQAFLYNAVFFTQGLRLTTFFGVKPGDVGLFTIPFAIGNFLGALVLGHFFDTIGSKRMIAGCYIVSGALLLLVTYLFLHGMRDATQLTLWFATMFFFASAGASAAYLTTSEIFPLEIRAAAIAVVYAVGLLIGGAVAPPIYGHLIGTKEPSALALAWSVGAVLMIAGGIVEIVLGVDAENKPLEEVASPLTQVPAC